MHENGSLCVSWQCERVKNSNVLATLQRKVSNAQNTPQIKNGMTASVCLKRRE